MSLNVKRAKREDHRGPFRPGSRVVDDTCDKLSPSLVRRLLESPEVLPETARWTPTRWLMKAAYEAVHGKGAAMASLIPSLRSATDNEAHVVDLYRKLSGDFGSGKDDIHGTGERAHARAEKSYVFSAQLRRWLHEIPAFVPVPDGYEPPPEPVAVDRPVPTLLDEDSGSKPSYQQTYHERTAGRRVPPALLGRAGADADHGIDFD